MSFKCDFCSVAQASGVKPIMAVPEISRREMTYSGTFIDSEGEVKEFVSSGWEAEDEFKSCQTCAGIEPKVQANSLFKLSDLKVIGSSKAPNVIHARSCKKPLGECKKCQLIVEMYAGLPLPTLSVVTTEPMAREVGVTIGSMGLYNAAIRAHHNSNRALRDVEAALPLTKSFRA